LRLAVASGSLGTPGGTGQAELLLLEHEFNAAIGLYFFKLSFG